MEYPTCWRVCLLAMVCIGCSCQDQKSEISVTEQRELTLFDVKSPYNIMDEPPLSWRQIPSTQFRLLNYLAGESEKVEIFIGISGGGVLGNANRWRAQFGLSPISSQDELSSVTMMERAGYLLEARGELSAGMGTAPAKEQLLFGAIVPVGGEQVLTVKLVGPQAEVEVMRQEFLDYCKSLKLSGVLQSDRVSPEE